MNGPWGNKMGISCGVVMASAMKNVNAVSSDFFDEADNAVIHK